ncbi:hypothetical protein AALP_AA6G209800 [Arabis alpina]|uniref:SHSP domain-containing protein n=1 Tax=Arabis alpina TaxID=50452 RepID=A0A087GQP3_ARAAL|nr:hypothetical protein AALP_AA6G209800 [Arabis alpina]
MVVPLTPLPPSDDGFYAINNHYLVNGPKGFSEKKILENGDLFVRIDFPGVPKYGVKTFFNPSKRAVAIFADAPKEYKYDSSHRSYGTQTGLRCGCCKISGITSHMSDGVFRLLLTKTHISQVSSCIVRGGLNQQPCTDPYDPALTGPVIQPHPCVNEGSEMAYESKQLQNGSLYVRLDMPGVPKDKFTVSVNKGKVMVTGEAPAVSHDSASRFYSGDVARLTNLADIPSRRIKTIAKNGVIRLIIPPL